MMALWGEQTNSMPYLRSTVYVNTYLVIIREEQKRKGDEESSAHKI